MLNSQIYRSHCVYVNTNAHRDTHTHVQTHICFKELAYAAAEADSSKQLQHAGRLDTLLGVDIVVLNLQSIEEVIKLQTAVCTL